jgi:hypothetical protein
MPIKILAGLSKKTDTYPKIHRKMQGTQGSQDDFEKE